MTRFFCTSHGFSFRFMEYHGILSAKVGDSVASARCCVDLGDWPTIQALLDFSKLQSFLLYFSDFCTCISFPIVTSHAPVVVSCYML